MKEETSGAIKGIEEKDAAGGKNEGQPGSMNTGNNGKAGLESAKNMNSCANQKAVGAGPGGRLFVYAGSTPNTGWCRGLSMKSGYLLTDESMQTSEQGVYAAGDIRDKAFRQISTALSDGTIAAIHASVSLGQGV